jgi:predicted ester cyclase
MGETKRFMERNLADWNAHAKAKWSRDFSDDCEIVVVGGMRGTGRDLRDVLYSVWTDAFPDNQIKPTAIIEDGENGVLEAVFEGTHTGPLNAPTGSIPPTGKRVAVPFVSVEKVSGGQFKSFHLIFDQVELMTQLGLMPAPAGRT